MASNLINITSLAQLKALPAFNSGAIVLDFHAPWSELANQLNVVVDTLATQFPGITFAKVEAEEVGDVSELYNVESVPTFVILQQGIVQDTLVGANPPELTRRVGIIASNLPAPTEAPVDPKEALNNRLKALIESSPVIVFIKGTVDEPRCGFSNKILTILKTNKITFTTFDILSDNVVREGLKAYSSWPTYPQLYAHGKLVGGLDIVKELEEDGDLVDALSDSN